MTTTHTRVAIVGAGPIGLELAVALRQAGIDYVQLDAGPIGSTMTWYPLEMVFHSSADRIAIAGVPIQVPDQQKPKREEYLAYLRAVAQQFALEVRLYERVTSARRLLDGAFELSTRAVDGAHTIVAQNVVLAIGAMHAPRLLGIPGEDAPHVSHYFREPHEYFGTRLLIVGGRNSAVEAAIRCQRAGADVTISYRGEDIDPSVKFWLLPEIRGMIRDGRVRFLPRTTPVEIRGGTVLLSDGQQLAADRVLLLTGYRQDPTLFEMLGVDLQGDARKPRYDESTMETNVKGVFVAGAAISGSPEERVRVIARAGAHVFHSSFWINLHDRMRHELVEPTKTDSAAWNEAVEIYRKELANKDPIFHPAMIALTNRLALVPDDAELEGDSAVDRALRLAAPVYRAKRWKEDDAINRFWISVATTLLREAGGEIAAELSRLYGVEWPKRLHIDVVTYGGRFGAYTPSGPPLWYTMVSSRDPGYQAFHALEMMFHEPLHHFDDHMHKLIAAAGTRLGIKPHRSLSHAILFYTSGEVAKRALARRGVADYKPVAYLGIHQRSWPALLPLLEQHWQAYLDGKITRDAALEKMIAATPPPPPKQ